MIVVSDTSAITSLIQVGRVDLLHRLYNDIYIPEAVRKELAQTHSNLPSFIRVQRATNSSEIQRLSAKLDLGEAEAITLAKEIRAEYLLMDETTGREVAVSEGVRVIGLLGVLLAAKFSGHLSSVREVTEQLQSAAGFRVSETVKEIILRAAGEIE